MSAEEAGRVEMAAALLLISVDLRDRLAMSPGPGRFCLGEQEVRVLVGTIEWALEQMPSAVRAKGLERLKTEMGRLKP